MTCSIGLTRKVLGAVSVALAMSLAACGGGGGGGTSDGGSATSGSNDSTASSGGSGLAPSSESPVQTSASAAVVTGKVQDTSGQAVEGVAVQVAGQTVTTRSDGQFSFSLENPGSETVLLVKKAGFATNAKVVPTIAGKTTEIVLPLLSDHVVTTFDSAAGALVQPNGAKVSIPANAIQTADGKAYSGAVKLSASFHNPDTLAGVQGFAGPYEGTDGGASTPLISAGVIEVKLNDEAGNPLQLKAGSTAQLSYPATSVTASAATIPMWYYDEPARIWRREGAATKQADGSYLASVSHFTMWNMDFKGETATLEACFKDAAGNAALRVGAIELRGGGWSKTALGDSSDGLLTLIRVPAGMALQLLSRAKPEAFVGMDISALAPGEVRKLPCATVTNPPSGTGYMMDYLLSTFPSAGSGSGSGGGDFSAYAGKYSGTFSGQETGTLSFVIDASGGGMGTWTSTTHAPRTIVAVIIVMTENNQEVAQMSVSSCPVTAAAPPESEIVLNTVFGADGTLRPARWYYCADAGKLDIPYNPVTIQRD